MKKQLFILTFLISASMYSSAQIMFQKTYGGTNDDSGREVRQTTDGGYIIVGNTYSYPVGTDNIYLIKTDANGDTLWSKIYGSTNLEEGFSIQPTTDGGYIIAGAIVHVASNYDFCLLKIDSVGNIIWKKSYTPFTGYGQYVQQTTDGGYIMGGVANNGSSFGEVCLLKTDANGDTLWTKTYGGNNNADQGFMVEQTADGGYIITGYSGSFSSDDAAYLIKTNASGDTLWTKIFDGLFNTYAYFVQQTSDGGYIITGATQINVGSNGDAFLIKTDSNGDTLWTKTYGGLNGDGGSAVRQTADGGYIIVGGTSSFGAGNSDIYLIKTNSIGDTLWTRTYGGTNDDYGKSVQQTTDGGYIITGRTQSFGAGNSDVYLIKTDSLGNSGCNQGGTATIVTTPAMQNTNPPTIVTTIAPVITTPVPILSCGAIVNSVCSCSSNFIVFADTIPHNWIAVNQASGVAPLTYLWNWGDGNTSTGATPSHIYNIPGYYNICLTTNDAAGCTSTYCDSSTYIFRGNSNNTIITINVLLTTNIIEHNINKVEVMVYPNPSNDIININSTIDFSASEIILFDASGRAVMEKKLNKEASFSIKHLNAGIYFYKIKDAKGNEARGKVVKE